jgi:hypothetical protein
MRARYTTALFAFFLLITGYSNGQGRMHIKPVGVYSSAGIESLSCKEIVKNAAIFDSLKRSEVVDVPIDTIDGWRTWTSVGNHAFGKNRGEMPMIADVQALHPYFRDKVIALIKICKAKGIELAFVETYRTHAKQNEYKGMGKKYTRSGGGKSKHQYGLAVDVVPIVKGEAQWHDKALWLKIGVVGEKLGLRWGGRWRHPFDPGHFEWTGGLNSVALASGAKPYIYKQHELYPCLEEDLKLLRKYWKEWEVAQSTLARN